MKVIRDKKQGRLSFMEEDSPIMELSWFFDEFVWMVFSNEPVIITEDIDKVFYDNLCQLMNNNYKFYIDNKLSFKDKNKLQWLSDQCVDLEDVLETDRINRLVIERVNDSFVIRVYNPFLNKLGVRKSSYTISFSPAGNGYMVKNIDTDTNLQEDVVMLFSNSMNIGEDIGPCLSKKIK